MRYGFAIGTSQVGLLNTEALPVPCLVGVWEYKRSQSTGLRGDLSMQLFGPAEVTWRMSVMRTEQRDQLKMFCPEESAEVYITTRILDDRDYHTFRAEMYWPEESSHQAGRVLDFSVNFLLLEEV